MIVTCPTCATRYLVDPTALRATGRTVRCARCSATWHQAPPDDMPAPPAAEPVTPPSMVGGGVESSMAVGSIGEADPSLQRFRSQLPAIPEKRRRFSGVMIGWVALGLVLIIIVGGLAGFRTQVAAAWPATTRLYSAIGWPLPAAKPNFDIRVQKASETMVDTKPVLTVTGDIGNISQLAMPTPPLRLVLKNKDKTKILATKDFTVDQASLQPGQTAPFQIVLPDPPADIGNVTVEFAPPPQPAS